MAADRILDQPLGPVEPHARRTIRMAVTIEADEGWQFEEVASQDADGALVAPDITSIYLTRPSQADADPDERDRSAADDFQVMTDLAAVLEETHVDAPYRVVKVGVDLFGPGAILAAAKVLANHGRDHDSWNDPPVPPSAVEAWRERLIATATAMLQAALDPEEER